ncbi:aspartate aminotransferase family protein [Candidatus Aerophobetes bacterium]|nr:aspartate aminotransferase family protein [Candidatus Aerophobetes bacterium]
MESKRTYRSKLLYKKALNSIAGGVASRARGLPGGYTPYPIYIERAKGSKIYDVDGNEYIDYLLACGPVFVGHAREEIVEFVKSEIEKGVCYGLPYELEIKVAEKVIKHVPCVEKVGFGNSGSEVVQMALRLARAYTGRDKVIKFEGHYHGWIDNINISTFPSLDDAGPEFKPHSVPASLGIPRSVTQDLVILPWNNMSVLENTINKYKDEIAAVITEPYMGNGGIIPPEKGYLETLRDLTEKNGIVLIFDEVITGFRLALGGAQEFFNIKPDLWTTAKALGGSFPIAMYGGKTEIMDLITQQKVAHAGTFNANRVGIAAAYATLNFLERENGAVYKHVYDIGNKLIAGIRDMIKRFNMEAIVQGVAPMFQIYFTKLEKIRNYREACTADFNIFYEFWKLLLERGILIRPRNFSQFYISASHTQEDVDKTLSAMEDCFKKMKRKSII